jgi:hypothetical protein
MALGVGGVTLRCSVVAILFPSKLNAVALSFVQHYYRTKEIIWQKKESAKQNGQIPFVVLKFTWFDGGTHA